MKILVTGSNGFLGKNLIAGLRNNGHNEIYEYDLNSDKSDLETYCKDCDFIYHLAGVNRTKNESDFMEINYGLTDEIIGILKNHNNKCPIMISSSIQAANGSSYGISKRISENVIFSYADECNTKVYVYRFHNIFGKWCKPNYNSVIATFCNNIARDLPIVVNDRNTKIELLYIDDVVNELLRCLTNVENRFGNYCFVPDLYIQTLGEIVDLINSFKSSRESFYLPNIENTFAKKLYSTYISYLPENSFSYQAVMNQDERGSFTELIKTKDCGQISVNIAKPGITKGNHWHQIKTEKFIVVSGRAVVNLRKINTKDVYEYELSSEKISIIDIPPGYTHSITNVGGNDLIFIIWANEVMVKEKPDTYFEKVLE